MKIEKKLDRIINILYDENLLHWREIPVTDFIAFAKNRFNINWSDAEINLILTILENDGYIAINENDINNMRIPSYSLTAKGVQYKLNGGFVWNKIKLITTNIIVVWAAIFTILISVYTISNYLIPQKGTSIMNKNKQYEKEIIADSTNIHDTLKNSYKLKRFK